MHKLVSNVLRGSALALAAACTTSLVSPPPNFGQPPTVKRIFAVDPPANSPFFSFNTGVTFGEVLIYSTDSADHVTATPPPSFTQFRIEFDQPIDATKLLKAKVADALVGTAGNLNGAFAFSYCTPLDLNNPGIQVVDIDTPAHTIVSSICYDPASQVGQNPHVTVIPGNGSVNANATPSPFTCHSFLEDDSSSYFSKHTYGIKFISADIASSANTSANLNVQAFPASTFTFKTTGFEIMAVGGQNSVTGYFDWIDKPYAGFMQNLPAIPTASEVDCDPAAVISRNGCRIFSDGSGFLIVTTQPVADATGVTLVRTGGTTAPDYVVDTATFDGSARVISIFPATTFEPGQSYTVTIDPTKVTAAPANGETNVTTLEKPATTITYTFIAGPGPVGPAAGPDVIYHTTPAQAAVRVNNKVSVIQFFFQLPVDPVTVTSGAFAVTRSDGKTIAGTPALIAGSNNQEVDWTPTTAPTLFGAVYTLKVNGGASLVKVGPGVPTATQPFAAYTGTFTTRQFTVDRVYNGGTAIDGTRNMPLESLLNGSWNIQFRDVTDPATVTTTTLPVTAGGTAAGVSVTDSGDHKKYTLKLTDTTTPIKFGTQYLVTATTGIKEATAANGGVADSTGQALHAENCSATDCPDARGFFTRTFNASISTAPIRTGPTAGNFTISFNYPIDPATWTGNSALSFTLVPGTVDPTLGFQPTGSGKIAVTCTLQAGNGSAKCTPASAPAANTYYRAIATLSGVKVATPFVSGAVSVPLDTTTGTFNGTLTQTYITDCP
jgi:hypothetical protein